ncbi:ATP-binding protein [Tranquillimonas alkanivorans]|uniref:histidine kinase n=1 Tax=Tranquillimonas alkanivorans TaxID=441119 RepID=A0A1I5U076_9RHOB|nr:ATP-binding protein [Tranquillimonas alkanivorans]SFP87966.1 His Kinase A (phospho-acceptor) domain-containing protein [Tranquillimonas alkanivorans]
MGRNRFRFDRQYGLLAGLIGILAVVAGVVLLDQDHQRHVSQLRSILMQDARILSEKLEHSMFEMDLVADSLAKATGRNPDLGQEQFAETVSKLVDYHAAIRNVAGAPDLRVEYVYPVEGNEEAIGLDYRSLPDQYAAVKQAVRQRAPYLDGPVDLVQGGSGYILQYPVFTETGEGRSHLWGVVSLVVSQEGLLGLEATGLDFDDVALRRTLPSGVPGEVVYGRAQVFDADPIIQRLTLLGDKWELAVLPTGGWPAGSPRAPLIVSATALAALLLIGKVLFMGHLAQARESARKLLLCSIEAMNDGFVLYDEEDRLVMRNTRAKAFYAPTAAEMPPGTAFEDIIREELRVGHFDEVEDAEAAEAWFQERLRAHRAATGVAEQTLADGRCIKIAESRTPQGYTVSSIVDVSELKAAQQAAERADRKKSEFLNNISHELRTPLTVILGYAPFLAKPTALVQAKALNEMLARDDAMTPEVRAAVSKMLGAVERHGQRVEGSAKHLLAMVNEILDWAHVERGKVQLRPERFSAAGMLSEIADEFEEQARRSGLDLTCDCVVDEIEGDPVRLKQVLYNLVGNALKFTDDGAVTLAARRVPEGVEFSVEDTGCGIDGEHLETIFEQFQQVDGSDTRRHGGTGLGLAIAKHLVELHGGILRVTSETGRGSRFFFVLPEAEAADVAPEAAEQEVA